MSKHTGQEQHHNGKVEKDQHGFVLLGEQAIYGAHLAMFHMAAHQYQVIVRMTLGKDDKNADARQKFVDAQKANPTMPHIVVNPENRKMLLSDMLNRRSFPGEIWALPDNDFDKKNTIASGLTVKIDKILHNRTFDQNESYPDKPRYLVFGSGERAHMAHYMTRDPDYQLVLDLATVPAGLSSSQLASGVLVELLSVPENHRPGGDPLNPFRGREVEAVEIVGEVPQQRGAKIKLTVGDTHWYDVKYLNMRPSKKPESFSGYLKLASV
jgi:hypothetical protein